MTETGTLFDLQITADSQGLTGNYGQGPTELETRAAIAEIEVAAQLTGARRTIKQLCIALAVSIDKGNTKGRAIANEAGQLFAMMNQLDPSETDAGGLGTLTPETERLFNGFARGPILESEPADADAPPGDHETEL
ncbi:hypothetical protein [Cryobacterium sp. Y62]|uniref:hypothetical protein n=1 Tax=Cryobacterium sp. Y62 TaxID=2048284 RepID=UPI000CE3B8C1|nr:hypothetical protein [Cryobacterium sp. Y62]